MIKKFINNLCFFRLQAEITGGFKIFKNTFTSKKTIAFINFGN